MAVIGSCTEQTTGPSPLRSARVLLQPQFSRTTSTSATLPISRIRMTARNAVTDAVIETRTETVDPLAQEWQLEFGVDVSAATSAIVTVELIHVTATGAEIVEWSGVTGIFV